MPQNWRKKWERLEAWRNRPLVSQLNLVSQLKPPSHSEGGSFLNAGSLSFFNAPGVISQHARAVASYPNFVPAATAFILQRAMALTFYSRGFWVSWFLGLLVSGFLALLVSRFLALLVFLVSWLLGLLVSGFLGCSVFASLGFWVSRFVTFGLSRLGFLCDPVGFTFPAFVFVLLRFRRFSVGAVIRSLVSTEFTLAE